MGQVLSKKVGCHFSWCMTPEEMVDGAINYYNLVQERLAYYRSNQVHSLEKMMDK